VVTPSPAPTPARTASASAAADPAIGLKIAAPYTLRALAPAAETAFRQQLMSSAGAFGSLIGVGGREAIKDGILVGFVFVVGFPTGVMNDVAYRSTLTGLESSAGGTFTTTTIAGTEVSTGGSTSNMGLYRDGDEVIILITPSPPAVTALAEALITAN
jgi:hypothetical protein